MRNIHVQNYATWAIGTHNTKRSRFSLVTSKAVAHFNKIYAYVAHGDLVYLMT